MEYNNILENAFYSMKLLMEIMETSDDESKKIQLLEKKIYKWLN